MKLTSFALVAVGLLAITAVILSIPAYQTRYEEQQTARVQACTQAGKTWVSDRYADACLMPDQVQNYLRER